MRPQEPEAGEMEELEKKISHARQGVSKPMTEEQRRNFNTLISEIIPRAVQHLQRQPMSAATARCAARFFAVVQDFVDACLRSPLLGDVRLGSLGLDLSPLVYVLRLLLSPEPVPVPPRYLPASSVEAAAFAAGGAVPPYYFNRDHGRPLSREFKGDFRYAWPDDDRAAR